MIRHVSPMFAATAAVFFLSTVACGESSEADVASTQNQELKKTKGGRPTGDGVSCSWDGVAIPGVVTVVSSEPGPGGDDVEPSYGAPGATNGGAPVAGGEIPSSDDDTNEDPVSSDEAPDVSIGMPAPLPGPYKLGARFPSLDGCNVCECTDRGIMCTVRACAPIPPAPEPPVQACPEDARVCDDGSVVTRRGPRCEFAPCPTEPHACTGDAMQCPDGSWVGRSGPRCEFACPR